MSLEQTSTTNEDFLLNELKYEISPGASYLLQKEQVRWQATGSNIYKPSSGQGIIRFNLSAAAPVFLNPQSARMMFTVVNNNDTLPLQPMTGPWGYFQRCAIRVNGTLAEDIYSWNRVAQMFSMMQNVPTRNKEANQGGGGEVDEAAGFDLDMDPTLGGDQRTVICPLFGGLFTGNTKYLWLSAMNITVEMEPSDTKASLIVIDDGSLVAHSDDFHIQDVNLLGDAVHVSPDLLSAVSYTHLRAHET